MVWKLETGFWEKLLAFGVVGSWKEKLLLQSARSTTKI